MFEFKFEREHVIKAIRKVEQRGLDWLYKKYPKKKGGGISKARTWFLIHEGAMYPLKHLGRCAYHLATKKRIPGIDNPHPSQFSRHFENLGFKTVRYDIAQPESSDEDDAEKRRRGPVENLHRPGQAEPLLADDGDAIQRDTADRIDDLYRAASQSRARPPWMDLLNRIASQTHMAPFNLMLADIQRPGARYIAFPQKWREIGREVKPGAIPVVILWPFGPVRFAFELADTTGDRVDDAKLDEMFGEAVEVRDGLIERVARHALTEDRIEVRSVSLGTTLGGDARAANTNPKVNNDSDKPPLWVVRVNSNLNKSNCLTTIAHELAHVYLGHLGGNGKKWPNRSLSRLDAREFEAEAVAFIVAKRFGLKPKSVEYLNGYLKKDTINFISHSAIVRTAGRIEQLVR